MKEYNRQTKRWEEKKTEVVGSLKKSDFCRGKKPHSFVLVLPDWIFRVNGIQLDLTLTQIEQFYESEIRRNENDKREDSFQETLGIKRRNWRNSITKYYKCEVCGKKETKS